MQTLYLAALVACVTVACAGGAKRAPDSSGFDAGHTADALRVGDTPAATNTRLLLTGARLPGGAAVDVEIRDGYIAAVRPTGTIPEPDWRDANTLDLTGRWIAPSFIDSHVHLSYFPVAEALLRAGVIAAVDLAAPESSLARALSPLRLIASGPMLTSVGGYPLDSWGSDGYGLAIETPEQAIAAVDRLISAGAKVIKLPLGQGRPLPEAVALAAIERAHERGRKVVVHALSDAAAALGARLGADVLAHTPVEALAPETIQAWRGRAVISTLAAFGGGTVALANLTALRDADVTVIYGTDLGNTRDARIDPREIQLLGRAGIKGAALLDAATSAPALLWGWSGLGAIAAGKAASLLVLAADPSVEPTTLATPVHVIVDGHLIR